MHRPPAALINFLKPYDSSIRELALTLRSLVVEEMAPCHENIYDAYNAVAIGYGPTDRLKDGIFHIAVYAKHVNLGFNCGATLDDPLGILKGTGKQIRHITLKTPEDIGRPEIRSYIRRALKAAADDARKLGEPWKMHARQLGKRDEGRKSNEALSSKSQAPSKESRAASTKSNDVASNNCRRVNASVNPTGVISVVKAVYPKKRRPISKS